MTSPTIRQCAVLVGGLGTRLGALAADLPKPLLPCGDRPFQAWLLRGVARSGVRDVVLLAGHRAGRLEAMLDELRATLPTPMTIALSVEPAPAGTGGALWHARDRLDDRFLLLNGDSLLDANLAPLLADAARDGPDVLARLALHDLADASRAGVVATEQDRIVAFRERPAPGAAGTINSGTSNAGTINAGIVAMRRGIVDHLSPAGSLERDVLARLAGRGALRGTRLPGWFIDIGIPADLARARAELPARLIRPALFLDRDGVINHDHGYVGSIERFEWTDGARAAIRSATDAGCHVFVVTNQSGVARGLYDEAAVRHLLAWTVDAVRADGGTIDDVRYCPYHPDAAVAAYRRSSDWRKPAPGMLRDLIRAWGVDPRASVLIGDQPSDLAAAAAVGMPAHLFAGGDLRAFVAARLPGPGAALSVSQDRAAHGAH